MTLREAVNKIASTDDRVDTKARLIGYLVLFLLNARSLRGLTQSENTPVKVTRELSERGVDIRAVRWDSLE